MELRPDANLSGVLTPMRGAKAPLYSPNFLLCLASFICMDKKLD